MSSKVTVQFCNPWDIWGLNLLHQHLVLPVLLTLAITICMQHCCCGCFNLHFLNNWWQHLRKCLYTIQMSSLVSVYSNFLPIFQLGCLSYLVLGIIYIFWIQANYQFFVLKIFTPLWLAFSFYSQYVSESKSFEFW